jgi:hypothetical protein
VTNRRRWVRRLLLAFSIALICYLASYSVLSATGGWLVSESGEWRPFGALAEIDIFQWQPRYGFCQRFRWPGGHYALRADALGYFYAPLILLDQRFVHPTIRFRKPDGTLIEPLPAPPVLQYHPRIHNPFAGWYPYAGAPKRK